MKYLIVEDEFVSRTKLQKILGTLGECHLAMSGEEALHAFQLAHAEKRPYRIITVDIKLPDMAGQVLVERIRRWEQAHGAIQRGDETHILMVSALKDSKSILSSFKKGCEGYITKPFNRRSVIDELNKVRFFEN